MRKKSSKRELLSDYGLVFANKSQRKAAKWHFSGLLSRILEDFDGRMLARAPALQLAHQSPHHHVPPRYNIFPFPERFLPTWYEKGGFC